MINVFNVDQWQRSYSESIPMNENQLQINKYSATVFREYFSPRHWWAKDCCILTLKVWGPNYSLRRQDISDHDIDYVE